MFLRILNGTARLFILMVFPSWIGMAVYEWNGWSDLQESSVESKIDAVSVSQSGERRLNQDSWPVVAAQPSFLNASVEERVQVAREFYDNRLAPIEEYYFLGHEGKSVKAWLVYTARLPLSDAPSIDFQDTYGRTSPYRDFSRPFFNINPRFTYVISNSHVLGTSLILAGILTILVLIVIGLLRWVYHGFVPKRRIE